MIRALLNRARFAVVDSIHMLAHMLIDMARIDEVHWIGRCLGIPLCAILFAALLPFVIVFAFLFFKEPRE